eukprot:m.183874 g.183874  ORF g.183874 m.183874 type:complete len:412 (-) comp15961_c0_seq1:238-1473(-)
MTSSLLRVGLPCVLALLVHRAACVPSPLRLSSAHQSLDASAPTCTTPPYRIFWNIGGKNYTNLDVSAYGFEPGSQTQTGGGCSTPNCQDWSMGLWPSISDAGHPINGGIPQNSSLAAHVAKLKETVVTWIPDPNWDGNAVFDFESWTPIWEQNTSPDNWHGKRYQDASIALVKQQHPTWNNTAVEAAAKEAFEKAGLEWFVTTLTTCIALRPKAKWGYYGIPQGYSDPCAAPFSKTEPKCGYNFPGMGDVWRAQNDRMMPLYEASTAIFPSVYLPPDRSPAYTARNIDYVRGTTLEAMRLATKGQPVRPFAWSQYHDQSSMLEPTDLHIDLATPGDAGADSVVLWGAPESFKIQSKFDAYLNSTLGPMALEIKQQACACSQAMCSGHGECVNASSACQCFEGYTGPNCTQH